MERFRKSENTRPEWKIWQFFIILLATFSLTVFVTEIYHYFGYSDSAVNLIGYIFQSTCYFLFPCWIVCSYYKQPSSALGLKKIPFWSVLPRGIGYGFLLYLMVIVISMLVTNIFPYNRNMQDILELIVETKDMFFKTAYILLVVVAAPVSEEVLFRGLFYSALKGRFGVIAAMVISAAVFAAMHLDPYAAIAYFFGGICLAYIYEKHHNLWYNIVAHATWNLIAVTLLLIFY